MNNPFEIINSKLDGVSSELHELRNLFTLSLQVKHPDDFIPRTEVAKMLNVDPGILHNWAKKGLLIPRAIAGRIYYKRSDIEAALKPIN